MVQQSFKRDFMSAQLVSSEAMLATQDVLADSHHKLAHIEERTVTPAPASPIDDDFRARLAAAVLAVLPSVQCAGGEMQGGVQIPLDIHFAQSSLGATDLNSCQSEHHADNVPVATHQPGVQNPPDSHFAQRSPGATELNNYQPEHHVANLLVAK